MKRSTFSLLFVLIFLSTLLKAQEAEDTIMLEVVVITDKIVDDYKFNITNHIDRTSLQTSNVRDVGELLRSVPNVSGIRRGGSAIDPVVRGYKYSQLNVILNNGIRIEGGCPNRMDPVSSHIEAEDIEHIEIIKGPFSMKYGPSFGGVINLVSPFPEPSEKFEIHANAVLGLESNWNGKKMHGSISGGNQIVFFQVGGGYRNYGNYQSGSREGLDTTFISGFRKYNTSAKLGFAIKGNHRLIASWDGIHGRDVMFPALPMDEKTDDTNIYAIDYQASNISPFIRSLEAKIYLSDVYHVMDNSNRASFSNMQMVADVDAVNTGGRAALNMQIGKHRLLTGMDYENILKDGKRVGVMSMMGTTSKSMKNLWLDSRIHNTGIFAEYKTFFSAWELSAGLRADYNTATSGDTLKIISDGVEYFNDVSSEYFNLSASLGIRKRINSWMDISVGIGRGTRSPNMLERYIKLLAVGYDRYDYLGNPQLKPETNNEIDLTFEIREETIGQIYLNFFYSYVQDFIAANLLPSSVVKPQSLGVLGVKQFYNADYITSKGFEFGFKTPERHRLGGDIVAAYTYAVIPAVTKYIAQGTEVVDAVELNNDALPEIPPFEMTMNIYYRMMKGNLVPRLTIRAVAMQDHVAEAFYEVPTPGFCVLNLSAKFQLNRFAGINAGITNLLDRSYYEHLNRRIIGSDIDLYEPGRVFFATLFINI
jgi:iron complex outermembrane recepter protein